MKYVELSFPEPEANLACDEAILEECEDERADETFRWWSAKTPFVVVGYSNSVEKEVDQAFCKDHALPILRRCTGGGTVVQGPGCYNFSLVLRIREGSALGSITGTNAYIMSRHRQVFQSLLAQEVVIRGHTDLVIADRKFSGNAQRRKRQFLLFHGSLLLGLDLSLMERALRHPSKEPPYRGQRSHRDFLTNLALSPEKVRDALRQAWDAGEPSSPAPIDSVARLVRDKYASDSWNLRF